MNDRGTRDPLVDSRFFTGQVILLDFECRTRAVNTRCAHGPREVDRVASALACGCKINSVDDFCQRFFQANKNFCSQQSGTDLFICEIVRGCSTIGVRTEDFHKALQLKVYCLAFLIKNLVNKRESIVIFFGRCSDSLSRTVA